jgi:hypothetical protein
MPTVSVRLTEAQDTLLRAHIAAALPLYRRHAKERGHDLTTGEEVIFDDAYRRGWIAGHASVPVRVPSAWRLAPAHPTEQMRAAGERMLAMCQASCDSLTYPMVHYIYQAMTAHAPTHPELKEPT